MSNSENNQKRICIVSTNRSDYGLLKMLAYKVDKSTNMILQLLVTGSHLSKKFGYTVQEIEQDGFTIQAALDISVDNDSAKENASSLALCTEKLSYQISNLYPDLIVLLGDRYELLPIATVATIYRIPIAHIHGGEITLGSFDDSIRHAITKLSHLHFVANETYRKRVIQMGENPSRVFNVGGLGVDAICQLKLLDENDFISLISLEM